MDDQAVMGRAMPEPLPRPLEVIEEQLRDLAEVLQAATEYGTPDPASQLGMTSLLDHQRDLIDEQRAAELLASNADAEISLEGDATAAHEVPANLLGQFLITLQRLLDAVAQVRAGRPTSRAPVGSYIVAEHRLLVQPAFQPTSFGVRLRLPTSQELNSLLDSDAAEALDTVCQALDPVVPPDDLADLLGHQRVNTHYNSLIRLLVEQDVGVVARTRRRPRGVRIRPEQARDRLDWLKMLQVTEETIERTGELVGGNIERDRFDLKCEGETLSGRVTEAARAQMERFHLGQRVTARVRVRALEHDQVSSEPSIRYLAEDFQPAPCGTEDGG